MKKLWTDIEIQILHSLYPHFTGEYVAMLLVRDVRSVYYKANSLGLKKTEIFFNSQSSGRANVLKKHCSEWQFKKGFTPWNKGMKGLQIGGEKTQFTKGNLPHNTLSDGVITKRLDKSLGRYYYWIRTSKAIWVMYHVYLWEREFGPVPKGSIVRFKDKDPMNCEIENLEMVTRGEHMRKNSIQRLPEEVKAAIIVMRKLKKTIKVLEHEK